MLKGYHSLTITLYAFIFIAIITAPLADWNLIVDLIKKDNNIFIFIILHSLLVLILPYVFYTVSLNYMDTGKASILASCEPIAASVFGIIFFNEIPNIFSVVGIILTITALTLLSINTNKN